MFLTVRFYLQMAIIYISVILEKTIRIPRSLSVKAASVLKGFLNKNPADRLGCHPETGFMDIVHHPFFKSIEWDLVSFQNKQIIYQKMYSSTRRIFMMCPVGQNVFIKISTFYLYFIQAGKEANFTTIQAKTGV